MEQQMKHLMYMPLLGLGLYGGHRGNRWLRNRIKIFKQFVLPSLLNQSNSNFILWISVRHEDRGDKNIKALREFLEKLTPLKVVFTYGGVCFWDDKHSDEVAHERLVSSLHDSMGELLNVIGEAKTIIMTIQPSDDVYNLDAVNEIQHTLKNKNLEACGYKSGYVMDYLNYRLCEWNPTTNPPFFSIKFDRQTFSDPNLHMKYTGPYKSHEYIVEKMRYKQLDKRGYIVGTHGENISTIFKHPFAQHESLESNIPSILLGFGLQDVKKLKLKTSLRKKIMRRLPYNWQRKLRYVLGERLFARIYNWIRS